MKRDEYDNIDNILRDLRADLSNSKNLINKLIEGRDMDEKLILSALRKAAKAIELLRWISREIDTLPKADLALSRDVQNWRMRTKEILESGAPNDNSERTQERPTNKEG